MTAVLIHRSGEVETRSMGEDFEAPLYLELAAPHGGAGGKARRFGRWVVVGSVSGVSIGRRVAIYAEEP